MSNEFKVERMHEHLQQGDFVVGRYSTSGGIIKPGAIKGDVVDIQEFQQSVLNSASTVSGAELRKPRKKVTTAKLAPKKGRPKKRTDIEEAEIIPLTPAVTMAELENEYEPTLDYVKHTTIGYAAPLKSVELHNEFGRIKLFVEAVQEIDIAFMLVFRESKDLIFIPAPGQTLNFAYNENIYKVYYADTVFPWIDSTKQLMILFKQNE